MKPTHILRETKKSFDPKVTFTNIKFLQSSFCEKTIPKTIHCHVRMSWCELCKKNIKPSDNFPKCNSTYLFTFQTCFHAWLLKISNKTCNSAKKMWENPAW